MFTTKQLVVDDLKNAIHESWNNTACDVCGHFHSISTLIIKTNNGKAQVSLCEICDSMTSHEAKFTDRFEILDYRLIEL